MFWIRNGNLKIGAFLIPLESKEIFAKHHLHRMNSGVVHRELCLEECFVALAIGFLKGHRSSNIKVMEEIGDVQKNRMASLIKMLEQSLFHTGSYLPP